MHFNVLFQVNEIAWNNTSDLFFLTNGQGCVHILNYPDLELQHVLKAHPGTCICIEFDPTGKYFATGSADALGITFCNENLLFDLRKRVICEPFNFVEHPKMPLIVKFSLF